MKRISYIFLLFYTEYKVILGRAEIIIVIKTILNKTYLLPNNTLIQLKKKRFFIKFNRIGRVTLIHAILTIR